VAPTASPTGIQKATKPPTWAPTPLAGMWPPTHSPTNAATNAATRVSPDARSSKLHKPHKLKTALVPQRLPTPMPTPSMCLCNGHSTPQANLYPGLSNPGRITRKGSGCHTWVRINV
jgi:hypothetical protein